jgi:hypothetical protein
MFGSRASSKEYGIVGEITVSFLFLASPMPAYSVFQPFTNSFPRADIHELLSPDLLHQLIKGAFKDHLVTWVEAYIKNEYTPQDAKRVLDDIDRR